MRRRRRAAPDLAAVSDTVLRLSVLLQSGLPPGRAWAYLAEGGETAATDVCARIAAGIPLQDAVAPPSPGPTPDPWSDVGRAWRVALTVGAPLAETLRALAGALRDAQQTADDVRIALAEPAGTARLLSWLPLVGVALGGALGFDTLGALVRSPVGVACLITGLVLIAGGRWWSTTLVTRARAESGIPALDADIFAIALSGGVSLDRARALAGEGSDPASDDSVEAVLALSRSAGVPAVELLRATASLARHRARVDGRLRATRLSSRLLLPLGVCTLPAFLLLGVAPMLLSVVAAVPLDL